MSATVTVSIGRNVGAEPMPDRDWQAFRLFIGGVLKDYADAVHVQDAASVSEWNGIPEESRTWVAACSDVANVAFIGTACAHAASVWNQDAVALTVAGTFFVSGAES